MVELTDVRAALNNRKTYVQANLECVPSFAPLRIDYKPCQVWHSEALKLRVASRHGVARWLSSSD